jgi:DNA-binding GntR family transcriptional regulator
MPQSTMINIHPIGELSELIVEFLFDENAFAGSPLTEQRLAEHFNTSRTPIREALAELEKVGIIERRQKKGIHLKRPSPELLAAVYDVRSVLEGFAGRLAASRCTKKDLAELKVFATEYSEGRHRGDHEACEKVNLAFHDKIIRMSGNALLINITNSFSIIRKAFQLAYSIQPELKTNSVPYPHEKIVAKLEAGDAEGCEKLLRVHIQNAKKELIEKSLGFKLNQFE